MLKTVRAQLGVAFVTLGLVLAVSNALGWMLSRSAARDVNAMLDADVAERTAAAQAHAAMQEARGAEARFLLKPSADGKKAVAEAVRVVREQLGKVVSCTQDDTRRETATTVSAKAGS